MRKHAREGAFPPYRRWTRRRRRASSFRNASSEGDALHVVLHGRYARARGGGGRRRGARRAMRKRTRAFPSRFVSRAVVARSETNFFGRFLKRPFFLLASSYGQSPRRQPNLAKTNAGSRLELSRSRNRSGASSGCPSSRFLPRPRRDLPSRVAHVTRRSGARAHAASAPSTAPPAGRGRAEPGRDERAGSRAGARAGTSFGWFVLPREAPRRRGRGRSRRDASDGDLPGRHERLPRSRCLPPR